MTGLSAKHLLLALISVAIIAVAIGFSGVAPKDAIASFFEGSIQGPAAWRQTLKEMTPLLLAGLAVFVALKSGLFNIGADGQLVVGAAAATAVVLAVPGVPGILLGCCLASVAGALWALPAAWIKAYKGGHEVISTIMLNSVAALLTTWIAAGPMRAPQQQSPSSRLISSSSFMPPLVNNPPFSVSSALLIGIIGVAILSIWLKKTVAGYELNAVGANPTAAETAGINVRWGQMKAMLISGAIAGFTGATLVLCFEHRFYANFSPGYGFDALGVALLSGGSAWGLIPASFLFAVLASGTSAIQLSGVPKGLNGILLGVLIVVFAAVRYRRTTNGQS